MHIKPLYCPADGVEANKVDDAHNAPHDGLAWKQGKCRDGYGQQYGDDQQKHRVHDQSNDPLFCNLTTELSGTRQRVQPRRHVLE